MVAFDGSPYAEHALNVAFSMAEDAKATLHVLSVMGKRSDALLHRWRLGSNTEQALEYAHCPVIFVHGREMRLAMNIAYPLD